MIKPAQKVTDGQRTLEWKKNSYDYYSGACVDAIDKTKAARLYRLAAGELFEEDYSYVTNPLNETDPRFMGYPSKMRNYDIISPNINVIIGDFIDRFMLPIVYAVNSNYDREQYDALKKEINTLLQKRFINDAVNLGAPLQQEQIQKTFEDIERKIKNLPNEMAKQGQSALNYIVEYCELARKFRYTFYDYLVTARCFSYRDVEDDEVVFNIVNAANFGYLCSEQHQFVENGEAARARYRWSINEIYDKFQHFKEFKEIEDYINSLAEDGWPASEKQLGMSDVVDSQYQLWNKLGGKIQSEHATGILVEHLNWRSFRKIYRVKKQNLDGTFEIVEYDEKYKPLPGEEYYIEWVDDVWEGYKIAEQHHIGIRRIPVTHPDNPKLRYNGFNAFSRFTEPQSLVEKGLAYQKKYNIVSYNMEATLNKSLDKLILFPLSLIPDKEGWDHNSVMYYAKALSFLFVNDTKSNFATAINGLKGVDMSLNQYVMQGYQILSGIKQQWDDTCGMSPQRKGDIAASAGKGTTQEGIARSYIINEIIYTEHEEFQARDEQDLLDLSQFAYSEGKRATFINRSGKVEVLDIVNPEKYTYARFGLFAKNGKKEQNKLNAMRQNAQAFAQNLPDPSLIANIINSDNYSELLDYMNNMGDELKAKAEQAAAAEQQMQQASLEAEERTRVEELQYKYYKTDSDNLRAERVATISAIKTGLDDISPVINNPGGLQEGTELMKMFQTRQKDIADNFMKLKEIEQKEKDLQLKAEEIASKERMNKDNNRVALKNKTVGEK